MDISFYFDPACPWTWITSRWLVQVKQDRDFELSFKPFSFAVRHGFLDSDSESEYAPTAIETHRLLRLAERIREDYGEHAVSDFYTRAGEKIHVEKNQKFDWIEEVASDLEFDPSILEALDDSRYDKIIEQSMDKAFAVVGKDVGVPIIVIEDDNQDRGLFGPVLSALPSKEKGLKLFDAFVEMINFPEFYELKRSREVDADTDSTRILFQ